jgi:PAS domain S-box-containing protein
MRKTIRQLLSGLRLRLLLLVLLACAPLVGLMLHAASEERRRLVKEWNQRSREMTELATREDGRVIGQTRQLLLALAESSPVRLDSRRDCKKLLDDLLGSYPRYANLGVVETNGMVLASAYPMGEPALQTNRPFFRRTLATRAFAIGNFPDGQAVDKFTVNFGYPVFDSTGQVQAVVFATLDLDWVSRFESALPAQLPKGATWTEIDRNGKILVRYPSPEKWIGQSFPEKSLLKTVFSEDHGVVEAVSSDGIPGYHAFAAMRSQLVPDDVVTILSSIPKQVLFAEADRRLTGNLAGLGIAAGFAFMLGWIGSYLLVLHPVRTLVKSSARLATGDLSTRTGLAHRGDELGQLTRTFDQMAQALEQREVEHQSADYALKASEMRYRRLFETAQDGILILNADTGQIDDVNPFLTDMLGYSREQLLGNKLWEIGPFKDTKASKAEFRELQREAYVRYDDLPLETSAGKSINVEFVSNVYQVNGGRVIQCNIRNITERKRAEEELRGNEVRLRGVVESTADGLLVVDRNGRVIIQNGRFGEMWRIPSKLLASGDDNALLAHVLGQLSDPEAFLAKVHALYGTDAKDMDDLCFKDGRVFERFSRPLVLQGTVMGRVWSFRDVTERKQAEAKRKEYNRKLQVLSRRLVAAQETERRNIARELHDEIGQALTVMQLNLQAMLQSPGADALTPRLNESLKVVERVLEQVHDISLDLRPSILDDLGLESALRWYTDRQAALVELKVEFHADWLEQRLDPVIETECFRVAQEALTNVVRHAQAKVVTVELRKEDGQLHLCVRDDGIGFEVAAVREKAIRGASLGLLSMEERAMLAGGRLEFNSVPGRGTEVHAWFPLKWQTPPSESETP